MRGSEDMENHETNETKVPPLSPEQFAKVFNNYYLLFLEVPVNYHRYVIPTSEIDDAIEKHERSEPHSFPFNPLLEKLREENPELERKLTETLTNVRNDPASTMKSYEPFIPLLYEAYLIQRKYLKPDENEGEVFCFSM